MIFYKFLISNEKPIIIKIIKINFLNIALDIFTLILVPKYCPIKAGAVIIKLNNKGEKMAIKLNDKWYDENKFTPEIKNAIVQINNYQKQVNNLKADLQNCNIIIAHHSKYIKENVPAAAEIDEPKADETKKPEEK